MGASIKAKMTGAKFLYGVKLKRLAKRPDLGLRLATYLKTALNPYVPMRTGKLMRSGKPTPFKVTYQTSYARIVYYGSHLNFSKERHAKAMARWEKGFLASGGAERMGRVGTKFLKG